jgi:hypothetical protein
MADQKGFRKLHPTDTLLSYIKGLEAEIKDEVEKLQPKPVTKIDKPTEFFQDIKTVFYGIYLTQVFR